MWSHKSKFWKGFWGCRGLKLGMIHGTLPAVIGFCRWQVKALLRLINTWRPLFFSKYGHCSKYWVKVLMLEEVVENWRDFGRNHKIGSNETKNNGWLDQYWERGWSRKTFLSVDGNKILNFRDSQVWQKRSSTQKLNLKMETKCIFLNRSKYTLEQFTKHCCEFL